jgi:hypothetical protein
MKKKNAVPKLVRYQKILQNVCAYEVFPEKRIIAKDTKKVLWKILLHQNGMEDALMGKVWMLASGAANLMNINKNYYFRLRDSVSIYPNPCFNQIELDLRRTFPYDDQDQVEKLIVPLRNVLFTFIKRNPTVGYCQGMNFIAGNILKHLNEE